MDTNTPFDPRRIFAVLSVLLLCWSIESVAAPVTGALRPDELDVANQLLNGMLHEGPGGRGSVAGGTQEHAVEKSNSMVVELLTDARAQVVRALEEAKIAGEVEVRQGTFLSGFAPVGVGVFSGSRHINLAIYRNGRRLGELVVGKTYDRSSVTPYARFTKDPEA